MTIPIRTSWDHVLDICDPYVPSENPTVTENFLNDDQHVARRNLHHSISHMESWGPEIDQS